MEKILFVAYQFPPRGGPGVQRSVAFVKNLRAMGFDPVVLTINEEDITRAGYQTDASVLSELPNDLQIIRTPAHEPIGLIRFLMKIKLYRLVWFFFYPLFWEWSARWPRKVYKKAEEIVTAQNIKLVYTTSGPFSSMLLGRMLQKNLGIKWVADLRDPYTDAYAWQFPSKLHWLSRRKFEKKLFCMPDKLVVNTEAVRKLYLKRELVTEDKITVITNGY